MSAFATAGDLAKYLSLEFSALDLERAAAALDVATSEMVAYLGRTIAVKETEAEEVFDPAGREVLLLANWPVTEVSAVSVDGTVLTVDDDVYWYSDGRLVRVSGSWGTKRQSVTVSYKYGYEGVPQGLKDVCLEFAKRKYANTLNLKTEGDQVPDSGLTDEEQAVLAAYGDVVVA